MARTSLTVQTITRTGLAMSTEAANATGEQILNGGKEFIYVANGGGAPITVTVQTPRTVDGLAVAELEVTIADGADAFIGPFPTGTFNQTGDLVYIDFSAVTSVTVAAYKVGS